MEALSSKSPKPRIPNLSNTNEVATTRVGVVSDSVAFVCEDAHSNPEGLRNLISAPGLR